jgi:benzylsuccinate CoA-transferase BbsF subunit
MSETATLPLAGIRVADFSWFGAGPIAGQTLATFGAEVIRVESEAHLDGLRTTQPVPPGKEGPNVSGYYNNFNAQKLSFTLNLGHPKAREVALRLIARSDIFLENYTPRVAEKWGLTYEDVVKVKPDIIYVQMPMQGSTGPHRDFLGFGGIIAPVAGYSYLAGWPDRPPVGLGTNYPDYVINPGHAVVAILAALRHRNRTGQGQRIELAQLESVAATLGPFIMDYTVNGRVPERQANRSDIACPHGAFRCKDGPPVTPPVSRASPPTAAAGQGEDRWIAIAVYTDAQWQGLVDAMGRPAWACEERFHTFLGRKRHEDELEQRIEEWTRTLDAEEAMRLLQAKGVPAGVVQTARDVLEHDEHLRARGYYQYLDHPETGRSAYDGPGFRLSDVPYGLRAPAPLLGQHNDYVLRQVLGYSDEEIAELVMEQVVF